MTTLYLDQIEAKAVAWALKLVVNQYRGVEKFPTLEEKEMYLAIERLEAGRVDAAPFDNDRVYIETSGRRFGR